MMKQIIRAYKEQVKRLRKWGKERLVGLFFLNLIVMLLVLLHSAGYFDPFYEISINFIVFFAMILAVFLLGARSRAIFVLAIIFWMVSVFFKSVGVDIWAERAGIYVYEALVLGVILMLVEVIRD